MEKDLWRYLTMFPSLSSPNQSLQEILSVNCWISHRWKLQLLTIENGSVVLWGMLSIMIELMWLISWEKMRQQAQQVKIGSLLPEHWLLCCIAIRINEMPIHYGIPPPLLNLDMVPSAVRWYQLILRRRRISHREKIVLLNITSWPLDPDYRAWTLNKPYFSHDI